MIANLPKFRDRTVVSDNSMNTDQTSTTHCGPANRCWIPYKFCPVYPDTLRPIAGFVSNAIYATMPYFSARNSCKSPGTTPASSCQVSSFSLQRRS